MTAIGCLLDRSVSLHSEMDRIEVEEFSTLHTLAQIRRSSRISSLNTSARVSIGNSGFCFSRLQLSLGLAIALPSRVSFGLEASSATLKIGFSHLRSEQGTIHHAKHFKPFFNGVCRWSSTDIMGMQASLIGEHRDLRAVEA